MAKSKRRRPAQPARSSSWLAACWGWLADLFASKPRKGVAKDAAANGLVGEILDRTLDNVDGC